MAVLGGTSRLSTALVSLLRTAGFLRTLLSFLRGPVMGGGGGGDGGGGGGGGVHVVY